MFDWVLKRPLKHFEDEISCYVHELLLINHHKKDSLSPSFVTRMFMMKLLWLLHISIYCSQRLDSALIALSWVNHSTELITSWFGSNRSWCSSTYVFFKVLQNSQENTCIGVFFNKVAGLQAWKATPTHLFSCECCELFKNSFFIELPSGFFWSLSSSSLFRSYFCT